MFAPLAGRRQAIATRCSDRPSCAPSVRRTAACIKSIWLSSPTSRAWSTRATRCRRSRRFRWAPI
jgi:hypothetical protein